MTKVIPLAEVKKQLSAIIKDVEEKFDRFTITRNGVSKAVILSNEEYEGLLETLDILSREEEREAIARAKAQVRKGKTVSLNSIKKKYDSEGNFPCGLVLIGSSMKFPFITSISSP